MVLAVPAPVVSYDMPESDVVANIAALSFAARFFIRVLFTALVVWQVGFRSIRVGEASNPVPAAARATKRRRDERKLAKGSLDLRLIEVILRKPLPCFLAKLTSSKPKKKKPG